MLEILPFLQIEWPWHCERRCKDVPTDAGRNLIILAGDRMLAANCDLATNLQTGSKIWTGTGKDFRHNRKNPSKSILMASCTEINFDRNHFKDSESFDRKWFGFRALDCVNGTVMPRKYLPNKGANYTYINHLFLKHGLRHKLDEDVEKIPYETDITIYNKTKVMRA